MGTEAIEYLLGQQCAPILAGIKPSNLLIVESGKQSALHDVLHGTGIRSRLLYSSGQKDYLLLFDREKLLQLLKKQEIAVYLRQSGYDSPDMEAILQRLALRFAQYKRNGGRFPHEMGVLFGYPLKDVQGFIDNRGKNYKMSGYWKVYDDVDYAGKMFRLYEYVKRMVLELCSAGVCISDICRACRSQNHTYRQN